jgi:hypothetical protein
MRALLRGAVQGHREAHKEFMNLLLLAMAHVGMCRAELNILVSDSTTPIAVSAPQLSNENLTFVAKNNDICCSVSTMRRIIPLDEIKSASVEDGCVLS